MDSSIIDANIVLIAELTHLKEHLGDYFWGKLRQGNTVSGGYTLSADEATLITRYIVPCLAFYVKYEVLNDMQYNTTSAGVMINEDDWSDSADSKEMGVLKDDTLRKANILRKDMMRWILDNENRGVFTNYEHIDNDIHSGGDNVTRLGGILAYGKNINKNNNRNERYSS
tara:strand:- start:1727 stop:2236 length:510 start_codon:yes stop_codon:yes gene_type:complete